MENSEATVLPQLGNWTNFLQQTELSEFEEEYLFISLLKDVSPQEHKNQCLLCRKVLASAKSLKFHKRTHTGHRPYACKICSKAFSKMDGVRNHILSHNPGFNKKAEPASEWKKLVEELSIEESIENDMITEIYGAEALTSAHCLDCKAQVSKAKRKEHYRLHTGFRPYTCKECGSAFATEDEIRFHCIKHLDKKTPEKSKQTLVAESEKENLEDNNEQQGTSYESVDDKCSSTVTGEMPYLREFDMMSNCSSNQDATSIKFDPVESKLKSEVFRPLTPESEQSSSEVVKRPVESMSALAAMQQLTAKLPAKRNHPSEVPVEPKMSRPSSSSLERSPSVEFLEEKIATPKEDRVPEQVNTPQQLVHTPPINQYHVPQFVNMVQGVLPSGHMTQFGGMHHYHPDALQPCMHSVLVNGQVVLFPCTPVVVSMSGTQYTVHQGQPQQQNDANIPVPVQQPLRPTLPPPYNSVQTSVSQTCPPNFPSR